MRNNPFREIIIRDYGREASLRWEGTEDAYYELIMGCVDVLRGLGYQVPTGEDVLEALDRDRDRSLYPRVDLDP